MDLLDIHEASPEPEMGKQREVQERRRHPTPDISEAPRKAQVGMAKAVRSKPEEAGITPGDLYLIIFLVPYFKDGPRCFFTESAGGCSGPRHSEGNWGEVPELQVLHV